MGHVTEELESQVKGKGAFIHSSSIYLIGKLVRKWVNQA
jgi:hypothetical protein